MQLRLGAGQVVAGVVREVFEEIPAQVVSEGRVLLPELQVGRAIREGHGQPGKGRTQGDLKQFLLAYARRDGQRKTAIDQDDLTEAIRVQMGRDHRSEEHTSELQS